METLQCHYHPNTIEATTGVLEETASFLQAVTCRAHKPICKWSLPLSFIYSLRCLIQQLAYRFIHITLIFRNNAIHF